jgi:opacity protein-like surface antigen
MTRRSLALGVAILVLGLATPALAFDVRNTFHADALLLSGEVGGGVQDNLRGGEQTDLEMLYTGLRLGWLPFGAAGPGPLFGAFEIGLEALYQKYTEPKHAFWAGLSLVGRYHFLSLGRFVPYIEVGASAGGTDLEVSEIRSDIAFLLLAGAGASVAITDRIAVYAGYRLTHVSNAGIERPNLGFEAHTGVAGVTFFLK